MVVLAHPLVTKYQSIDVAQGDGVILAMRVSPKNIFFDKKLHGIYSPKTRTTPKHGIKF